MCTASHDDPTVNVFPIVIRGGLSCCRTCLRTSHPAGMPPTTVPRAGRESSKGTAPLCVDDAEAPCRTTATFPRSPGHNALAVLPDLDGCYAVDFMSAPSG